MNTKTLLAGVGVAALLAAAPVVAPQIDKHTNLFATEAQAAEVNVSIFFDSLGDHGRWYRHRTYDYVFIPVGVSSDWAPYTHGRWVYTDTYGWYWASSDPHGWATHHYGRWIIDADLGWVWVPGNVWGPAWVAWNRSDDHIGWAPLPARGTGYAFGYAPPDAHFEISVNVWNFVEFDRFGSADLVIIGHDRNDEIYGSTRPVGHVFVENNVAINFFIDVDEVEERSGEQVHRAEVEAVSDPGAVEETADGERIVAFQEELPEEAPQEEPAEVASDEEVEQIVAEREAATEDGGEQAAADTEAEAEAGAEEDAAEAEPEAGAEEDTAEAEAEPEAGAEEDTAEAEAEPEAGAEEDTAEAEPEAGAEEEAAEAEPEAGAETEEQAEAEPEAPAETEEQAEAEPEAPAETEEQAEAEPEAPAQPEEEAMAEPEAPAAEPQQPQEQAQVAPEAPAPEPQAQGEEPVMQE
jgi:hypothetical protein